MSLSDIKLLVVEDNLLNQKLIYLHLKRFGVDMDFADNGSIALEKIKSNRYDVVLMDLMMPVMDGLEACDNIRKEEKKTGEHLIIIGLTANTFDADREKCLAHGMDEYMAKPFELDLFFEILKKLSVID
jgi:CheY-like chemotaxis protein